jgi:hypothetical protein
LQVDRYTDSINHSFVVLHIDAPPTTTAKAVNKTTHFCWVDGDDRGHNTMLRAQTSSKPFPRQRQHNCPYPTKVSPEAGPDDLIFCGLKMF